MEKQIEVITKALKYYNIQVVKEHNLIRFQILNKSKTWKLTLRSYVDNNFNTDSKFLLMQNTK